MMESAVKAGKRNEVIPMWLRLTFILPCIAGAIWFMLTCGSVFDYIADIQIGWFDGYYVVITVLLTVVVYLLILLISLIPALLLTLLVRPYFEKKHKAAQPPEQTNERSKYQ